MKRHLVVCRLQTILNRLVLSISAILLVSCVQTRVVVVTATPAPTPTVTATPPEPTSTPGLTRTPTSFPVVVVTTTSGQATEVYINTLRFTWKQGGMFYTIEREAGLPLVGGTTVPFDKMKRFDLISDKPFEPPLNVTITLLDGETLTGEIAIVDGTLTGETDLGSFSLIIFEVKSVVFPR